MLKVSQNKVGTEEGRKELEDNSDSKEGNNDGKEDEDGQKYRQ